MYVLFFSLSKHRLDQCVQHEWRICPYNTSNSGLQQRSSSHYNLHRDCHDRSNSQCNPGRFESSQLCISFRLAYVYVDLSGGIPALLLWCWCLGPVQLLWVQHRHPKFIGANRTYTVLIASLRAVPRSLHSWCNLPTGPVWSLFRLPFPIKFNPFHARATAACNLRCTRGKL